MLKVFIVDDEPLARDELDFLLKRTKLVEVIGEADSIDTAIEQIHRHEPDVVFLDIQLADESGLEIAARLQELVQPPEVIFATAYDNYALKAYELNAIDYILKPFDETRVQQAIDKLLKIKQNRGVNVRTLPDPHIHAFLQIDKLAITVDERIVILDTKDIIYIGTFDGRTVISTTKQKYQVSETLVTFEKKLQRSSIVRVHRAYLINLNKIAEIEPWFNSTYNLILQDGEKVPVSRTYTKALKQMLGF